MAASMVGFIGGASGIEPSIAAKGRPDPGSISCRRRVRPAPCASSVPATDLPLDNARLQEEEEVVSRRRENLQFFPWAGTRRARNGAMQCMR